MADLAIDTLWKGTKTRSQLTDETGTDHKIVTAFRYVDHFLSNMCPFVVAFAPNELHDAPMIMKADEELGLRLKELGLRPQYMLDSTTRRALSDLQEDVAQTFLLRQTGDEKLVAFPSVEHVFQTQKVRVGYWLRQASRPLCFDELCSRERPSDFVTARAFLRQHGVDKWVAARLRRPQERGAARPPTPPSRRRAAGSRRSCSIGGSSTKRTKTCWRSARGRP